MGLWELASPDYMFCGHGEGLGRCSHEVLLYEDDVALLASSCIFGKHNGLVVNNTVTSHQEGPGFNPQVGSGVFLF